MPPGQYVNHSPQAVFNGVVLRRSSLVKANTSPIQDKLLSSVSDRFSFLDYRGLLDQSKDAYGDHPFVRQNGQRVVATETFSRVLLSDIWKMLVCGHVEFSYFLAFRLSILSRYRNVGLNVEIFA